MDKKSVNLETLSIEELQQIQGAAAILEQKKRGEEARKQGQAFKRLKDIPPFKEHAHNFKKVRDIGEDWYGKGKRPAEYQCKECFERAYYCPTCGYVPGSPRDEKYDDIEFLSGSRGINHHCTNCNDDLGRTVLVRS